jgi:hypothetical protein
MRRFGPLALARRVRGPRPDSLRLSAAVRNLPECRMYLVHANFPAL